MRSLLPVLLVALVAWPVLAQEKAPSTADPELAALEQELLDAAFSRQADLNYNGKCDPEEKALALLLSSRGAVSVSFLEWCLGQIRFPYAAFHEGDSLQNLVCDYQKRHPGPLKASELRQAMVEESALLSIASLAGIPRRAGWRDQLRAQLLKEEDRNHDGVLDHDELFMRGTLDQALSRIFGENFVDRFDVDGDGKLSLAEREAVVTVLQDVFDVDQDGQVSLNDLQVLNALPSPLSDNFSQQPFFPAWFKAKLADFTQQFLPKYDRNGDGHWQAAEMADAAAGIRSKEGKDRELESLISQLRPNQDLDPAEKAALAKEFLANRDLNGNGKIDAVEIPFCFDSRKPDFGPDPLDKLIGQRLDSARPPIPEKTLASLCQPGISLTRLSRDPRIPADSRSDIMNSLLTLYDSNHDGKLDAEEAWSAYQLECLQRRISYWSKQPFSLTIQQQQAWLAKLLAMHDENHDGRLNPVEAYRALWDEGNWMAWDETTRRLDKDGNGWLDLEERQPLEAAILKSYDLNHNGQLERNEVEAFAYNQGIRIRVLSPMTAEQRAEWEKICLWYDVNGDGKVDVYNGFLSGSTILFNIGKSTYPDLCRWREFMLKNYDANHDGRIDGDEMQEYQDQASLWDDLARCRELPENSASMSELRRWALEKGDANGDGQLSKREIIALEKYQNDLKDAEDKGEYLRALFSLEKFDTKHPTLAEQTAVAALRHLVWDLAPLHPELARNRDDDVTTAGMLVFARQLLQVGNRNGDGHLDYGECYRLWQPDHEKAAVIREERWQAFLRHEEEQKRRQQEAEWLKKYDFNGNGKLDPEERTRAEADSKAGIQVPARDE